MGKVTAVEEALVFLRRIGGETEERDRLVQVMTEAEGKLLQREGGDLAKVVPPILMRSR